MMKNLALVLVLSLASSIPAVAAEAPAVAHLDDPIFGFSVDLPSIGNPADAPIVQRFVAFGPAVDGFAPNCNLQIQYTPIGLDAYLELTREQFTAFGVTPVRESRRVTSGLPAAAIEYTAGGSGRELRHLALAVAATDRVWLLTCTALDASFSQHRPAFGQILDSFAVKQEASPDRK